MKFNFYEDKTKVDRNKKMKTMNLVADWDQSLISSLGLRILKGSLPIWEVRYGEIREWK
jgi:hypothetical protein